MLFIKKSQGEAIDGSAVCTLHLYVQREIFTCSKNTKPNEGWKIQSRVIPIFVCVPFLSTSQRHISEVPSKCLYSPFSMFQLTLF